MANSPATTSFVYLKTHMAMSGSASLERSVTWFSGNEPANLFMFILKKKDCRVTARRPLIARMRPGISGWGFMREAWHVTAMDVFGCSRRLMEYRRGQCELYISITPVGSGLRRAKAELLVSTIRKRSNHTLSPIRSLMVYPAMASHALRKTLRDECTSARHAGWTSSTYRP